MINAVQYSQFAELFPPVVLTHHDVFQSRPLNTNKPSLQHNKFVPTMGQEYMNNLQRNVKKYNRKC